MSVLLQAGADPSIIDCDGATSLHYAVNGDRSKELGSSGNS